MSLENEIVLRPRFKKELDKNYEIILKKFEENKLENSGFIVTRVDNHVFIRLPKDKQHFWSPQLHLEISNLRDEKSILRGLFGPKPAVWTMFMFAHLIVACLFTAFGIWAYANVSLEKPYIIQVVIMIVMVIAWIALYFIGRTGKTKGKDEMLALHKFMNSVLS